MFLISHLRMQHFYEHTHTNIKKKKEEGGTVFGRQEKWTDIVDGSCVRREGG